MYRQHLWRINNLILLQSLRSPSIDLALVSSVISVIAEQWVGKQME